VDDVNPVVADLWVYTEVPGRLELIEKAYTEDGMAEEGWSVLPGTGLDLEAGEGWHTLVSDCLEESVDGRRHVRARFTPAGGEPPAASDLHYVDVDVEVDCP
jgi:hypothetical protein